MEVTFSSEISAVPELNGDALHETALFTVTAVITSNPTRFYNFVKF
jgi:hypothetical protein